MNLYEIDHKDIQKHGSAKKAIEAGDYILRVLPDFYRRAFMLGHGTAADMNRYMQDNKIFCAWYDEHLNKVKTI